MTTTGFIRLLRPAGFGLAFLSAAAITGCAGSAPASKPPYIEARRHLFVGLPAVPSAADTLFATLAWTSALFASELRKEVRFQLGLLGVSTPEDSVVTRYRLELSVDIRPDGVYLGMGRLDTPDGRREIRFRHPKTGNRVRFDASLEDIRQMAKTLAKEAYTDPRRKRDERLKYKVYPLMHPLRT